MYIGHATLGIESLCKGPLHIDYQLTNSKFAPLFPPSSIRNAPCGRISFNCTIEQQCVWGMKFLKIMVRLKDSSEIDLTEGNLWRLVVSRSKIDGEEQYSSTDTSIPAVTDQMVDLDAERKV